MTEEEKLQYLARLMGNGNTTIGQVIMDNHGTMNINNNAGEKSKQEEQQKKEISPDMLAQAILNVQDMFWGNSSYAVLFCVCRDCYSYPDNRSQFERMVELLPNRERFSRSCTPGVISSTINDNPYMTLPVDKWEKNGAPERVIKLVERIKDALGEGEEE